MIILIKFIILAAIVVFGANQLSKQADIVEENSNINAVLIGLLIAIATSLPELATGITSAIVGEPTMAQGNVLGSNAFNFCIIAIINIIFFKEVIYSRVDKELVRINYFVLALYVTVTIILLTTSADIATIARINIGSIVILAIYFIAVKALNKNQEENTNKIENVDKKLLYSAGRKFGIYSLVILIAAVFLSLTANQLMEFTGLNASFVGAIFIGISTSLPELTSAVTLTRMKAYNLAVTSVLSSNLFNFIILAIVDIASPTPLYEPTLGLFLLVILGYILSILTIIAMKVRTKNWKLNLIIPVIMLISYIVYVVIGG